MTFAKWLEQQGLRQQGWTNRKAASVLGVTEEHVRLLRAGLRRPSERLADMIFMLSDGKVAMVDFNLAYEHRQKGKRDNGKLGPVRLRRTTPSSRATQS